MGVCYYCVIVSGDGGWMTDEKHDVGKTGCCTYLAVSLMNE